MSCPIIKNNRKTIGLVMDNRWGSYSESTWTALNLIAIKKDINLVMIPTETIITKSTNEHQFNLGFRYLENKTFDGIIMLSSIVRYSNMFEKYQEQLTFILDTPTISIGNVLPGALSSIVVDNSSGIIDALNHLIDTHNLRKIAFITGPLNNAEAVKRFDAYKTALSLHNIPIDPELIIEGSFFIESGLNAGKIIYETRKVEAEAILCSNDDMAIGFMQYCIDKGISIPDQIKIIGFDNVREIQFSMSPLASIEQSYQTVTELAVKLLMEHWEGKAVDSVYNIDSQFIKRTSCGCEIYPSFEMAAEAKTNALVTLKKKKKIILNRQINNLMLEGIHNIMSPKTQAELLLELPLILSKLNIRTCLISLFNPLEGQIVKSPLKARIDLPPISNTIFSYHKSELINVSTPLFPSELLIHPEIQFDDHRYTLVLEPLYFNEELFGTILFELGLIDSNVYETIRRHLSNAIKLHNMINYLSSAQKHLVQSEKMAALGTLVAGVAHEINTPIGIGVTAASYILDQTSELEEKINMNQLTRKDLLDFTQLIKESTNILFSNLQKASNLISGFKNVSADQIVEDKRTFDLVAYTHQVKNSLMPETKKYKVNFLIEGNTELTITSFPGAYAQILTNLIINTLMHGYIPDCVCTIAIRLYCIHQQVHIEYSDNGKGIPEDIIDKIFDPFFTTQKGNGGTGLGLNIVFNIITQKLKGEISCKSTLGKGTTFKIKLPVEID